ncbi:transcription-repair coupling factor [Acetobacter cerevisiae]|uniref:Transcription-repair-coupling factor n=1 Tax=Acetobacter cerevisiae TaxID=178900 RepID=A0ABT1EQ67_9PROT|nr:transcription-repair coupling factor [Acetobacter cerevisiae]MCP1244539.1 transcription-repair coupling factor [Acetobacter cerevisiae]MCP1254116.1 transcription-repair coupling factor [Acetobacter cerevisiae]
MTEETSAEGRIAPIWGVPEGYDALLLAKRAREHKGPVLHIARDDASTARLADMLAYVAEDVETLRFPAWDCLPYDRVSPNPAIVAERVATLTRLLEPSDGRPRLVLTTVSAAIQRVSPRSTFEGQSLTVKQGESLDQAFLIELLIANGYTRTDTVMEAGEFASRGGIFDLFPAGAAEPVRLDLFGDEVENIRAFDPGSQRSTTKQDALTLRPVSEFSLDAASISRFRTGWRDVFGPAAASDPLYEHISDGRRYPGIEHWLPLFHERLETLFDYLPNVSVSLDYQVEDVLRNRLEMIADHYQARRQPAREGETPYRALPPHLLYLDSKGWEAILSRLPVVAFSPYAKPDGAAGMDVGGRPGKMFAKIVPGAQREQVFTLLGEQVRDWGQVKRKTYVTAWTKGSRERIGTLLREHGVATQSYDDWASARKAKPGSVGLLTLGLERGFVADDLAFVSEQDLLGERIGRPPRRRRRADELIAEAGEISAGDLVVHQDYGIGRYDGLETVSVGVAPHDCLRLLYDGGEKLYLPVENIELLSRFGSDQAGVPLDKLGGVAWQGRKAKMKQRIRDMAGELIRTAAARALKEAPVLAPAEGMWDEFCARFPFVETDDQSRAIADVLDDMGSGRPMDRLVCGDVGFGKTEVALRAAFVAAMSGGQVAVVVPTTLLARQHYRTFAARFEGFPIKVAQLSRMVTGKEATAVRKGLADGSVNIVIGTHALLAKTVQFASLDLLIIDEEQHFGVGHKEKLKALREDVHVLTLSATPLPRTLQLSLSGVREMSLIATPPTDRLAVRTFIMPFDSVVIREAIQRERFRGGQIFCVAPRVEDLDRLAERLSSIVPDAKVVQAHGRLTPTELERVMTEFSDGKYDILLSTNIVESGLDMPAVNTLIIHRADMFGLGQLYQLRGRVGRGKQRGYAYLTWPQTHALSTSAEKRLEVMQTLDTLGAGFTLASHDLDLRGAGNLLGDQQSGHVREVGIELYQQMLEDAVADLRNETSRRRAEDRDWTPNIIVGLPVLIPDAYVPDLPVRLGLYRRISGLASDAELEAMEAELVDRFGTLPPEVKNLLDIVDLKRLCRAAGVERLEAGPKGMVLQFRNNSFKNPAGLVQWMGRWKDGAVRLRLDHKMAVVRELTNAQRIDLARCVLRDLVKLTKKVPAEVA